MKRILKMGRRCAVGLLVLVVVVMVVVSTCFMFTYSFNVFAFKSRLTERGELGRWNESLYENLDLSGINGYASMQEHPYMAWEMRKQRKEETQSALALIPKGYEVGSILSDNKARSVYMDLAKHIYNMECIEEHVNVLWDGEKQVWILSLLSDIEKDAREKHTLDMMFSVKGEILLMTYTN